MIMPESSASGSKPKGWRKCTHGDNNMENHLLGIAKNNFNQDTPHRLPLDLGDTVIILRENDDWYYGYINKNKSQRGIFPKTYVQLVDADVHNGEYSIRRSDFVKEISTVLADWRDLFKHFYLSSDSNFQQLRNKILELIRLRSQILTGNLPVDELREVKLQATNVIDTGNSLLGLDMIVRDSMGNVLEIGRTSTTHLYEQHVNAESRIRKSNSNNLNRNSQTANNKYTQHLLLTVHAFVCKFYEADTLFTLYDGDTMKAITENFCVKWGAFGRPLNADQCSVLFTDLSSADLTARRIYLICQVVRWGGMDVKHSDTKLRLSTVSSPSSSSLTATSTAATMVSSLVRRQGSTGSMASDGQTSNTAASAATVGSSNNSSQMRRPFGVAFYDLTPVLKNASNTAFPMELNMPFVPCEKESFDATLRKLISTSDKGRIDAKLAMSVDLINGETKQIKAMHSGIVLARKMGFPEVILPGEVRNDLYLTLVAGEFSRGSKSSDKNIEVTVAVCNELGALVPGVLSLGAGATAVDEYRSVIYYHDDRPKWNETFRIQVSIEEFKLCHLRFTFKHRSSNKEKDRTERPYGFAYVRLMQSNGTALQHQQHQLVVYKIDQKKLRDDGNSAPLPSCYLPMPSLVGELAAAGAAVAKPNSGGLALAPKDSFTIETNLCSTKLTQDVHLLGLLNWAADRTTIVPSLVALTRVSPEEVVKFLQDILDALFDIMRESEPLAAVSTVTEIDIRVFDCLLRLIEIVDDKKYQHFQSVLDLYINESFSATLAYRKLISVLQKHIVDNLAVPNDGELYRPVRNLQYIIKFIIRSRVLHANLVENRDHQEFEVTLKGLLDTFVELTSSEKEMLRSQGTIVKFLPIITNDLMQVYSPVKLCEFIIEVIQRIPANRLVQWKRHCIKNLVNSKMFCLSECRAILLPVFCQQIKDKLNINEEGDTDIRLQEKNMSKVAKLLGENTSLLHSRETTIKFKIDDCLNIMSNILDLLFNGATDDPAFGNTDADISTIMHVMLRTVIQMASTMKTSNRQMVAVMLGILRSMRPHHYQQYVRQFARDELQTFLIEILSAFYNLVSRPVFPAEWMDMIMHQNTVILDSLRQFTDVIMDTFFAPFEKPVWTTFFHCSIAFLTQPSLQLHRFASSKKTVILQRYEDIRRRTADEIRNMWEKLGEHKPSFVPELVGPLLEMSLIPDAELRKATIPIFFDMMQCEWFSSRLLAGSYGDTKRCTAHCKGSFEQFEKEMIRKLDILVESGHGDAEYHELFERVMVGLCRGHAVLCEPGVRFVEMVSGLLGRLLEYRHIMQDESKENRMACTVSLLEYYKLNVNRSEMYIRYVDKLCSLHEEFQNYAEAAFTLRLHSCLLEWTDAPLSSLLRSRRWPECQTHRQLKEQLCQKMIELFDGGELWECAIDVCKELAYQFEHEVYDYRLLGETHVKLATFYRRIIDKKRHECMFFRVAFYGQRFAEFLRNRVFVYRGKEYERLSEFCTRLLTQHPNAELLQTMAPGDEIALADGQFILVNSVEPICEAAIVGRLEKSSAEIAWYYRSNDVRRFKFSRPYRVVTAAANDENEIGSLWLERTEMVTRSALPGILKWSQVLETTVTNISPLQHAIETMQSTNKIIRDMVVAHISDKELPVNPLSMKITGVLDAAVMGGLAKYEEAFLTNDYLRTHVTEATGVERLKGLIADQIPLLEVALHVHRAKASADLALLQERLEKCFVEMQSNVETKYGKRSTDLRFEADSFVTMRRPGSGITVGSSLEASNRHSETSMGSSDSGFAKFSSGNRSQAASLKSTFSIFNASPLSRPSLGSPSTKTPKSKDKTPNKRRNSKKIDRETAGLFTATSQWYTGSGSTSTLTLDNAGMQTPPTANDEVAPAEGTTTPSSTIVASVAPTTPVVELTEELTPQRPLRSEVERERRQSRPTSTITPTSSVQSMLIHSGDTHSLSGESSNRNSVVTTDSTASDDDNVPPPLPAKMRESTDYSSFDVIAGHGVGGALYEIAQRASLGRSLSMSCGTGGGSVGGGGGGSGSGRYTNKPLPAVPQQLYDITGGGATNTTVVTSVSSYNQSYDQVDLSHPQLQQQQSVEARVRRAPPTPPPKPTRNSKSHQANN